jgi:hypothetical protein
MNTANVTTAKEKSIYLINKFRYILECDNNEYFKECILICLDEILKELEGTDRYKYWKQVKADIKNYEYNR